MDVQAEMFQGGPRFPLDEMGATEVDCSVDTPNDPHWLATECIEKPYWYRGDPVR
jgi:hypothetical protein